MPESGVQGAQVLKINLPHLNKGGKGQLIWKANCQAVNFSKKRTNEFIFTTMRHVFVCFLEEMEDTKKSFRNYLTFNQAQLLLDKKSITGKNYVSFTQPFLISY